MSQEEDIFQISLIAEASKDRLTQIAGTLGQMTDDQYIGNLDIENINSKTPNQGQTTMANSSPVVIASDQDPIPVSMSGDIEIGAVELKNATDDTRAVIKTDGVNNALVVTQNSQPLPTGASTAALQTQPGVDIGDVTVNNAAGVAAVNIQDGGNSITVDGSVSVSNFPATQPVSGTVAVTGALTDAELRATPVPVSGTVTTSPSTSSTGTQSNVASSASDVTILAANANRKGAMVFNDSSSVLYLLVASGTSSLTVYSNQLGQNEYYEVPFGYTGALKGIWVAAVGFARVTELT